MRLAVVGTGYVGLVTGACFAELGNDVTCYDIDADKIEGLDRGEVPIYEPGLKELIDRNRSEGRLEFTTKVGDAIPGRDVVFICVGTPQKHSGKAELTYVFQAAEAVVKEIDHFTVIVDKSTVPVGTARRLTRTLAEVTEQEFEVISNPEFLREGAAIKDFQNPDRIVIGTESERAKEIIARLYSSYARINRPILYMSCETAELIKYAANAMLACRISFMNSLTGLCEKIGADIKDVATGLGLDDRIGPRFLQASPGYGGSCFPKDVRSLIDILESHQVTSTLFRAIDQVNELHKKSHVARIQQFVPELNGRRIAVWGLAFKPRTDDIREAPSLTLIEQLLEEGCEVCAYDPEAAENTREFFPRIDYAENPYDAVRDAAAVVLMTEWDVFRSLDFHRVKELMAEPVVIDCRNIYDPKEIAAFGFDYLGVGREMVRKVDL
ncbi:MAG: UDP-glucose/GDP-mannose dehydrogenase family protein [Planctomycetes bacterium]|nr:UDP-glucose/GDP-mannose dehydrogenase family protein [Planctomycetota bacterium]